MNETNSGYFVELVESRELEVVASVACKFVPEWFLVSELDHIKTLQG